jgi:hypothetical protein
VNVGELLRERDRLLSVIDEAKSARSKLKQVNVLIAMYGDAANVDLVTTNGKVLTCEECGAGPFENPGGLSNHVTRKHSQPSADVYCPECNAGPLKGQSGLAMHNNRVHTGKVKAPREKATKARKVAKAS